MMTLHDSVQLAAAKLKTHRVRTAIVVIIASLLFAGIVLVLTMLTGAARLALKAWVAGILCKRARFLTNRYFLQVHQR